MGSQTEATRLFSGKNLLNTRIIATKLIQYKISNDSQVDMWYSSWLLDHPIVDTLGFLEEKILYRCNQKVSDFRIQGRWKPPPPCNSFIATIWAKIRSCQLDSSISYDQIIWKPSPQDFTVKSAYESLTADNEKNWAHLIWNFAVIPRHDFLAWRVLKERICTLCFL